MTPVFLSLWLPFLPTDRLRRSTAHPDDLPLVTAAKMRGAQRIAAVDARARDEGIRPGMGLADARAVRPGLLVEPADPSADAAMLERLADWCGRFTPLVALDGADGLVLDIAGAAHLFGGEDALTALIEGELSRHGFAARTALAATPEGAWALARFGTLRRAPDPADERAVRKAFEPLPLAALRLDPAVVRSLAQAGLRQVGDLLWRPRAPLAARFGEVLFARLDAALGRQRSPIAPRFAPPCFMVERRFASPLTQAADVERTILVLAEHLCALLARHGKGVRAVDLRLFRVDGAVKRLTVGTSRPLVKPADIARLFRERIEALGEEGLDTGYGFDVVRLGALRVDPVQARQDPLGTGDAQAGAEEMADLVDRLGARLGLRRVTRLAAQDAHLPEFAVCAVPAAHDPPRPARGAAAPPPAGRSAAPTRPIRLFERPEPIETVAAVPDGPPLRFTWRRATHEVAAIEGPERIAPPWWNGEAARPARDYFRAEDREGRRFWLFREGMFAPPAPAPRWFVHGLFG